MRAELFDGTHWITRDVDDDWFACSDYPYASRDAAAEAVKEHADSYSCDMEIGRVRVVSVAELKLNYAGLLSDLAESVEDMVFDITQNLGLIDPDDLTDNIATDDLLPVITEALNSVLQKLMTERPIVAIEDVERFSPEAES